MSRRKATRIILNNVFDEFGTVSKGDRRGAGMLTRYLLVRHANRNAAMTGDERNFAYVTRSTIKKTKIKIVALESTQFIANRRYAVVYLRELKYYSKVAEFDAV